jgi:nucleotide-binding universal stress UspA family protein
VELTTVVLEWAALLMRRDEAAVTLVHIVGAPSATADAEVWLARLAGEIGDAGRVAVEVLVGTPGSEVAVTTRRLGADLIVMGRRGKGRAIPGELGSTVSDVLRSATCPVLVVVDAADAILDEWGTEMADADVP